MYFNSIMAGNAVRERPLVPLSEFEYASFDKIRNRVSHLYELLDKFTEDVIKLSCARTVTKIKLPVLQRSEIVSKNKSNIDQEIQNLIECNTNSEQLSAIQYKNQIVSCIADAYQVGVKKQYEADVIIEFLNFHIKIILVETSSDEDYVDSIDIEGIQQDYFWELSNALKNLKRKKNVPFLFNCLKQYVQLYKQRQYIFHTCFNNVLFEISLQSNGSYLVKAESRRNKYFTCIWGIHWTPNLLNVMHFFEVTLICEDPEFIAKSSPLFESLCGSISNVEAADERLEIWLELNKLLMFMETNAEKEPSANWLSDHTIESES